LIPPWSPCGRAVSLLRSCYTTQARFFREDERTTEIRWFFTAPDAPFVDNSGPWDSRNWDSDPKGLGELGEVVGAERKWSNGTPPADFRGSAVFCGTPEQWRNGEALPPAVPVPVDQFGVPLCCAVETLPLPQPFVRFRSEELPVVPDGTEVTVWKGAPGTTFTATAAPGRPVPTLTTDPVSGKRGLNFVAYPTASLMDWRMEGYEADFAFYLVVKPPPSATGDPVPGPELEGTDGEGFTLTGSQWTVKVGADLRSQFTTALQPDKVQVVTFARKNGIVTLSIDGILVGSEPGLAGLLFLTFISAALSTGLSDKPVWVSEIDLYDEGLTTEQDSEVLKGLFEEYKIDKPFPGSIFLG